MEVTKCLKPSDSGSRIGNRASVQAATQVNAEQASHDEGLVKGRITGTSKGLQLLRYPRSKPICATRPVFRARSTSHAVAACSGCTKIPLSAGRAQDDENHSRKRHFRPRFATVRLLDPPGLIRSWEMAGLCWCIR